MVQRFHYLSNQLQDNVGVIKENIFLHNNHLFYYIDEVYVVSRFVMSEFLLYVAERVRDPVFL